MIRFVRRARSGFYSIEHIPKYIAVTEPATTVRWRLLHRIGLCDYHRLFVWGHDVWFWYRWMLMCDLFDDISGSVSGNKKNELRFGALR
jgi:hypothetical protein